MQRRVVIPYRRFGINYRYHRQESINPRRRLSSWISLPLTIRPIGCTETSSCNNHWTLHNIAAERSYQNYLFRKCCCLNTEHHFPSGDSYTWCHPSAYRPGSCISWNSHNILRQTCRWYPNYSGIVSSNTRNNFLFSNCPIIRRSLLVAWAADSAANKPARYTYVCERIKRLADGKTLNFHRVTLHAFSDTHGPFLPALSLNRVLWHVPCNNDCPFASSLCNYMLSKTGLDFPLNVCTYMPLMTGMALPVPTPQSSSQASGLTFSEHRGQSTSVRFCHHIVSLHAPSAPSLVTSTIISTSSDSFLVEVTTIVRLKWKARLPWVSQN